MVSAPAKVIVRAKQAAMIAAEPDPWPQKAEPHQPAERPALAFTIGPTPKASAADAVTCVHESKQL